MAKTRRPAPAKQAQARTSGSRTLFLIVGFVAIAALLIAVVLSGTGEQSSAAELNASVTVTGGPLPPTGESGAADPAAGLAAPEVRGEDFDGNPVEAISNGKPKIIILLAHWCNFCQAEVPKIQAWVDENGLPTDVEILSIATSINRLRENFPAEDWLAREKWTLPVIIDDQAASAWQAFGGPAFPAFILVDKSGNVIGRPTGAGQAESFDTYLDLLRSS